MPSFPLAQSSAGVHTRAQPGVPMPAPSPSGLPDQLSGAGSPPTSPTGDPMKCSLSRYPPGRKGGEAVHSLNPHLALLSARLLASSSDPCISTASATSAIRAHPSDQPCSHSERVFRKPSLL